MSAHCYTPCLQSQTIINSLLAFDAYFAWYYALRESVPFQCPMPQREARAFDNMCKAIDQHEMFERVSINNHKSFLPHIAIYKVRDVRHWSRKMTAAFYISVLNWCAGVYADHS